MDYTCGNYQAFQRKLLKDHNMDLSNTAPSKIVTLQFPGCFMSYYNSFTFQFLVFWNVASFPYRSEFHRFTLLEFASPHLNGCPSDFHLHHEKTKIALS